MSTLYIHGGNARSCEYWYRGDAARAKKWPREAGQRACRSYNLKPLSVNLRNGICYGTNFRLVEAAHGEFVIGFEVPDGCLAEALRTKEPWQE